MRASYRRGFLLTIVVVTGCAMVQGRLFEKIPVPEGKSIVYAYRPSNIRIFGAAVQEPALTCGEESFIPGRGGYHVFIVDPGTTVCYVNYMLCSGGFDMSGVVQPGGCRTVISKVDVPLTAGQESYVRYSFGLWGSSAPYIELIKTEEGRREIRACKLQQTYKID